MLGFVVLGAVLVVTLVFALAAYLIDRGEQRLEDAQQGERTFESDFRGEQRLEHRK